MATVYFQRAVHIDAMVHHLQQTNQTMFHLLIDTADYHEPEKIAFEEFVLQFNGSPDELRLALTRALNKAFDGSKV